MDTLVKDPVYVTGHQNPDTDSIVSAIAYAALRNALGDREYVAARLGNVSDETQRVLDKFDAEPPVLSQRPHPGAGSLRHPPAMATACHRHMGDHERATVPRLSSRSWRTTALYITTETLPPTA